MVYRYDGKKGLQPVVQWLQEITWKNDHDHLIIESNNNELGTRSRDKKPKDIRKIIREDRAERESWIKQYDKTIIAFYHGLYKCDRLVPDPPWGSQSKPYGQRMYNAYRHYVRNDMSKEYHYLMDCLSDMLSRVPTKTPWQWFRTEAVYSESTWSWS